MAAPTDGVLIVNMVHGSGLIRSKVAEFPILAFQATQADGYDRAKAIRMPSKVAALGSRGDYVEIAFYDSNDSLDASVNTTKATLGKMSLDVEEYFGVPLNVQQGYFGKHSPFATPRASFSKKDAVGILHESVRERYIAGGSKVGLVTCQATLDSSTSADARTFGTVIMIIEPDLDGVVVIRAGAIINMDISTFTVV